MLQAAGAQVHLAHPLGVKAFAYRRVKNDELPEAWIAPPPVRELRELVRYRAKLVALRSGLKAQVHAAPGAIETVNKGVELPTIRDPRAARSPSSGTSAFSTESASRREPAQEGKACENRHQHHHARRRHQGASGPRRSLSTISATAALHRSRSLYRCNLMSSNRSGSAGSRNPPLFLSHSRSRTLLRPLPHTAHTLHLLTERGSRRVSATSRSRKGVFLRRLVGYLRLSCVSTSCTPTQGEPVTSPDGTSALLLEDDSAAWARCTRTSVVPTGSLHTGRRSPHTPFGLDGPIR